VAAEADRHADLLSVADYFDSITDVTHHALLPVVRDAVRPGVPRKFIDSMALVELSDAIRAEYRDVLLAVVDWDLELAQKVIAEKDIVQRAGHESRVELRRLLRAGEDGATEGYRLASRITEHLLRVYYLSKRVAKRIVQSNERMAA